MNFEKKDKLYNLEISKVTDSEPCSYFNAGKLLFHNTLRESTCSRVLKTAEKTIAALLSELSIDPIHIELGNISVTEI